MIAIMLKFNDIICLRKILEYREINTFENLHTLIKETNTNGLLFIYWKLILL